MSDQRGAPAGDPLTAIQRMQFSDLARAQEMARDWLVRLLRTDVGPVVLRPQPTSLNSFNGIVTVEGRELFFKSHIEPDGSISEYYNSEVLHDAGYHVVLPVRDEHSAGQQIIFYPVMTWPVMFDLMRQAEFDNPRETAGARLLAAEEAECRRLMEIYARTGQQSTAAENASAPVHQLFYGRLHGARFPAFYASSQLDVPGGAAVAFGRILDLPWVVNGVAQQRTLGQLVEEARQVLDPRQAGETVVGHGDAHYGNVFLDGVEEFLYFDPAFAGRHDPLLDVVKPLFHNVFAQWMYYPQEVAARATIDLDLSGGVVRVDYRGVFTALRRDLLEVKSRLLIEPLLGGGDARRRRSRTLQLALMCCPLLTMNLTDGSKFPPSISWLGLALALQMGNWDAEQDFAFT